MTQPNLRQAAEALLAKYACFAPGGPTVREAIEALRLALAADQAGWRDIASAPRDGTPQIVLNPSWAGDVQWSVGRWAVDFVRGEERHGWWIDGFWAGPQPTLWLPLPSLRPDPGEEQTSERLEHPEQAGLTEAEREAARASVEAAITTHVARLREGKPVTRAEFDALRAQVAEMKRIARDDGHSLDYEREKIGASARLADKEPK